MEANNALRGIGVKVMHDFGFRHVFGIHTLCSGARPPRELGRCGYKITENGYAIMGNSMGSKMRKTMKLCIITAFSLSLFACGFSSDKCYEAKEPNKQIAACTKEIGASDYKQEVAYNNRCSAFSSLKQYDFAIADCKKAIELNPKYASPHIGLGNIYFNKGQYNESVGEYTKAIELSPGEAPAYTGRGVAYEAKALHGLALADHNMAIKLNPKYAVAWMNRGNVFIGLKQFDQALADYNRALELDPNYPPTYYNKACLYAIRNDSVEACKWLTRYFNYFSGDYEQLRNDKDFDHIRNAQCYKDIIFRK